MSDNVNPASGCTVEGLVRGDYVLATKYSDGDPMDHFCVGFFSEMLGERFLVVDSKGVSFRRGGFRRCEKISQRVGDALVKAFPVISDKRGRSLWWWRRHVKALDDLVSANIPLCVKTHSKPAPASANERNAPE